MQYQNYLKKKKKVSLNELIASAITTQSKSKWNSVAMYVWPYRAAVLLLCFTPCPLCDVIMGGPRAALTWGKGTDLSTI